MNKKNYFGFNFINSFKYILLSDGSLLLKKDDLPFCGLNIIFFIKDNLIIILMEILSILEYISEALPFKLRLLIKQISPVSILLFILNAVSLVFFIPFKI